jgi:hypothetical protein
MLTYYPPRQAPSNPRRKAGKGRSFRALCAANGYSFALTQAALETAARRAAKGLPIVWPTA